MKKRITLLMTVSVLLSCSQKEDKAALPEGVGIDVALMDTTVSPGEDFFRYVNGGWLARTEIPADQGGWGSFNELRDNTSADVLAVLNEAAAGTDYPQGSDQRKAADFYSIGMDSALAEQVGLVPLKPIFDQIEAISNKADIQQYFTGQTTHQGDAFFELSIYPDLKKSDQMIVYIESSGLGLPERDYYLDNDDKAKETRQKYVEHVAKMLELSGVESSQAPAQAAAVMAIETKLAQATMKKEDRRDPDKIYNKWAATRLKELAPSFFWADFFNAIGANAVDSVIVENPDFMKTVDRIISSTPVNDIKAYFRWHLVNGAAPFLHHEAVQTHFDFYSGYLRGIKEMRPRWKRVLDVTSGFMGEAIGKLYVDKKFPPEAKEKALVMVENIKLAFADRIKGLDWMSDSTKEKALEKLSTFTVKIGYPDEWKDYSALVVEKLPEKASYIQNVLNGSKFRFDQEIAKLGKPVNKKEWFMNPQTVNAYYNPTQNEIVFPAAILQPPFYDYRADEALNYGGIGAVIGHEISHGFDDQGAKFDGTGNRVDWWTEADLTQFQERGKALADQFNAYEPLPGVSVNGEFTLGENIGDLGGVAVAYDGLQRHLREHGRPGLIDGFTPEQRFFLSWATIWRIKYRDETLRTQVKTDPHSPGMYRANGPLTNLEEFYQAFGIKEGDKMYRPEAERVKIW